MDPESATPGEGTGRVGTRPIAEARYDVEREIGRGGMGRVYRVHDRQLGRTLAMKVLDPRAVDEHLLARFLEEARLTSQLDHPGIVPVHDVGELEDGRVFYTMPLVDGRTLDEVLALMRQGVEGWTRTRVLHALLKACEAISYAHARGVVHRDLKPANLMIGRHGEVLVMDWGLARRRALAGGSPPSGTPATMAPEVLAGRTPAGRRADVYSFGAILYALCVGRLPYEDLDAELRIERILAGPPTPIASVAPAIPADLVAIAEKAMARDPADRYASMEDLHADLERFAEGRIVAAHPVGRVARVRKWVRRHPQLGASLTVVFVLLFALAVVQADKIRSVARAHAETLRRAYVANLGAAEMSLQTHEVAEAKRRLTDCDPALRGWEWRHLWSKADTSALVVRVATGADVDAIAAAPDGETFATGSGDRVALWGADDGAPLATADLGSAVRGLAYASNGAALVAGLADGSLVRLDARDLGELARTRPFESQVDALIASPDGSAIAACSTSAQMVYLARAGFAPLTAAAVNPTCLAFVGADTLAVGLADPAIVMLDTRDLAVLSRVGGVARSRSLASGPDCTKLAIGSADGRISVLDLGDETLRHITVDAGRAHAGLVGALAWARDGDWIVSGSDDKTLALWNAATGTLLARRFGHEDRVEALAVLPGARGILTASADGTARVWRVAAGAEAVLGAQDNWARDVALCGEGHLLASIDWSPRVRVWRTDDAELEREIPLSGRPSAIAAAPDGDRLACAVDDLVLVLDVASGATVAEMKLTRGDALALEWISDGAVLVRNDDGELELAAPGAAPRVLLSGLDELNGTLAFSRARNLAAVGTPGGDALLIDVARGVRSGTLHAHARAVTALAFDRQGRRLLAGASDGTAVVLDVDTGAVLASLDGHDDRVTAAAFASDGSRAFTASKDRTVRVWRDADLVLTLRGHTNWLTALDVQANGETVASASQDGTVRLWRAPAARILSDSVQD
jgi:WD40 repeat protein